MTATGYWLVLIVLLGVLLPIGLRLLAVPVIRADERRHAESARVAAGPALAREVERPACASEPDARKEHLTLRAPTAPRLGATASRQQRDRVAASRLLSVA